jgi:NAD+ synthase (glutamine-hydrolysing)
MKIALAQINPTVGDFSGNLKKILLFLKKAERGEAGLCIFPEMAIPGYPARDLLLDGGFIDENLKTLERLAKHVGNTAVIVGFAARTGSRTGRGLFNAGALIREGKVQLIFHKMLLPSYDVFDELRYFDPASHVSTATIGGTTVGLSICEDIWNAPDFWKQRFYSVDPVEMLAKKGAGMLVTISSSPFVIGRRTLRHCILKKIASGYGIPVFYVNQVGGNDQLIFDGCSMALDARGEVVAQGNPFEEDLIFAESHAAGPTIPWIEEPVEETVYRALVLGVRDYARKCGFKAAVIGLSGGIDSAVTACIAVEALGRKNVIGIAMPSMYSSKASVKDARELADNLGIRFTVIQITRLYRSYIQTLRPVFRRLRQDETEENIQARIRGNILMALSNKFGYLVLSTGNKSEVAVGYCTLYGDMTGGLAALSDVPKTLVYELSHYINQHAEIIPESCIVKDPSAELKPGQKDQDSLPPYDVLDAVLTRYVEKREKPEEIIAAGYDRKLVWDIICRVERNEYKRNQAPPGLKVTSKAFGPGRRIPLAQKYHIEK